MHRGPNNCFSCAPKEPTKTCNCCFHLSYQYFLQPGGLKGTEALVQSTPYPLWLCTDPCGFSGSRVETTRSPQLDSAVFIQFHLREAQFTPNSGLCRATHLRALFSPFSSIPSFNLLATLQFSQAARSQVSLSCKSSCHPVPHTLALLSLASELLEIWHHPRFQAAKLQTALLFTDLANSPPVKLLRAMARASTPQGSLRQRGGASKQTLSESTFAPEVELDKLSKAAASSRQNVQRGETEHKIALTLVTILGFVTRFWGISHPDEVVFDEVHFGKVRAISASLIDTVMAGE